MRTFTKSVIEEIKQSESLALRSYLCPAGKWTLGYGATIWKGKKVTAGMVCTKAEAEAQLLETMAEVSQQIEGCLKVKLTDPSKDALVSLVFNIGIGHFLISGLRRNINSGMKPADARIEVEEIGKQYRELKQALEDDKASSLSVIGMGFVVFSEAKVKQPGGGYKMTFERGLYERRKREY